MVKVLAMVITTIIIVFSRGKSRIIIKDNDQSIVKKYSSQGAM